MRQHCPLWRFPSTVKLVKVALKFNPAAVEARLGYFWRDQSRAWNLGNTDKQRMDILASMQSQFDAAFPDRVTEFMKSLATQAMARVKMNSPITIQPVTNGPAMKRSKGFSTRKAMMAALYHEGGMSEAIPRECLAKSFGH
jgi:hypothetical protein